MPEIAELSPFCDEGTPIGDWFGSPRPAAAWSKMWESPKALGTFVVVRVLDKRSSDRPRETSPSRMDALQSEIRQIACESAANGAVPVDERTQRAAIEFAGLLPSTIQVPEVGADPDGEISFDWLGPANKIFSVSIDGAGRLAYAGRFGEKQKTNGVDQLSDSCPPEIVWGIKRATA